MLMSKEYGVYNLLMRALVKSVPPTVSGAGIFASGYSLQDQIVKSGPINSLERAQTLLSIQDKIGVEPANLLISYGEDFGGVLALYGFCKFFDEIHPSSKYFTKALKLILLSFSAVSELLQINHVVPGTYSNVDLAFYVLPLLYELNNIIKK